MYIYIYIPSYFLFLKLDTFIYTLFQSKVQLIPIKSFVSHETEPSGIYNGVPYFQIVYNEFITIVHCTVTDSPPLCTGDKCTECNNVSDIARCLTPFDQSASRITAKLVMNTYHIPHL